VELADYKIFVQAVLDTTGLQAQLNQQSLKTPVKIPVSLNADKISQDIQKINNQLSLMQVKNPIIYNSQDVQDNVIALESLQDMYAKGQIPLAQYRAQMDNVNSAYRQQVVQSATAVSATDSFGRTIEKNTQKVFQWMVATTLIYGSLREIGKAVQYIEDLNKSMTDIQIVTGASGTQIANLAIQYNALAKEIGANTLEVAKGSLEWARQGKTVEETTVLLKDSMMMSKLANLDAAQSTEYMTSIMNGFKLSVDDMLPSLDKLLALDNSMATSTGELASAMQYSAAVANQAGVSYDELAAYIGTVSSVTRLSSETIGQSFKTMFTRMEQIKIGKLFEDDTTTINQVAVSLHAVGIEIMKDANTFRPMGEVLNDLAGKWDTLNQKQQNAIAGTISGKRYATTYSNIWEFSLDY
jgi:TP901 family phage tail tape measure protein